MNEVRTKIIIIYTETRVHRRILKEVVPNYFMNIWFYLKLITVRTKRRIKFSIAGNMNILNRYVTSKSVT